MTDEEIEKALEQADDLAINETVDCCDALNYIRSLKANLESVVHSFTRMETLYKEKCKELEVAEEKLQANLEKAYKHNTEECNTCMKKLDFKREQELDCIKGQICKETAKEILQELYTATKHSYVILDEFGVYTIKPLAKKYGVEVEE